MAYVYELIDNRTGKWYVGSRTSKRSVPEELGVSYFSSSKTVSRIFKAEPERFQHRIIVISDPAYVIKVEASILELRGARRANAERKAAGVKRIHVILNPMSAETRFTISSSGGKIGGKSTSSQRYRCLHCGMISAPGPLGVHQSKSNHVDKEKII